MSDVERCERCEERFGDDTAEESDILRGVCLDCAVHIAANSLRRQVNGRE